MKPIQARKDTKASESAWARRVKERDKYKCMFETRISIHNDVYMQCGVKATDAAHIYRRWLCGKAKFHDDVGLAACRTCHTAFDQYVGNVRVPIERHRAAYDAITAVCKIPLPGERP